MTAGERRVVLLRWMQERRHHEGLTARQIVDVSGIYDSRQHYRYDRCLDDLKTLAVQRRVVRAGRPACWWVTR